MVRGNWQKRVEMADARRKEGKKEKRRMQDKRVCKTWMQDFLVQLDHAYYSCLDSNKNSTIEEECDDNGNQKRKGQKRIPPFATSTTTLHVWSDIRPNKNRDTEEVEEEANRQQAAIDMKTSSSSSSSSSSGRTLSAFRKSKKKLHPRSKVLEQNKSHHHSEAAAFDGAASRTGAADNKQLLCKRHFFHGKGSGGRQDDDNDSFAAEASMMTTMAAVLKRATDRSQIDDAFNAEAVSTGVETTDHMDMVYYLSIDLKPSSSSSSSLPVSDSITAALTERYIPLSSVVYVVLQDTLLYDRYRNGSITRGVGVGGVSSKMSADVHERRKLANNVTDIVCTEDDDMSAANHDLPNAILEHILMYLPDTTAVTVLSRVCKAWHREISSKSASPNLWIHLLQRQGWPVLSLTKNEAKDNSENDDKDYNKNNTATAATTTTTTTTTTTSPLSNTIYREQYIKHYLAMRNARALALGVAALLGTTRYNNIPSSPAAAPGTGSSQQRGHGHGHHHQAMSIAETEMTYSDFIKRRKFAPKSINDTCVALVEWSPEHVLAAFAQDCTLRLFQAVRSNYATAAIMMMTASSGNAKQVQHQQPTHRVGFGGSGGGFGGGGGGGLPKKRCKELICLNIDPYRSTKKRTCTLEAVAIDAEYIGCLCSVSAENVLPSSDTHAAIIVLTSRDDFLLGECSSSSAAKVQGGGSANAIIWEDSNVIDIGEAVLSFLLCSDADHASYRYMPLMNFLSNGGAIGDVSIKTSWNLVACGRGRFLVEVSIAIPLHDAFDQDAIHHLDRKVVLFSANAGSMVLWMGESYPMHTGSLPPAHNSAMVMAAGCAFSSTSPRSLLTVAIRSEREPSILVYEMDCCNVRTRQDQQEAQKPPRFVEESCLARNDILAQLAAATTIAGEDGDEAQQVEWRVQPSHHLLVTSSDIVAMDLLQCHIVQVEQQNLNDAVPARTSPIRDRKTILSFYPHGSQRSPASSLVGDQGSQGSSYDLLTLSGTLHAEGMMNDERNNHIIVLCTELQKKERRGRGQLSQVQHGIALEDDVHDGDGEEEGEDAGGLDGEWFGANQDVSHCWEESLVLVVVHVPSRREIGRKTLPETKVILTRNQVHDYDSRSSPSSSWRLRLSSVSAGGGTLGLALNVVGIILTGDDVRCLGPTDRILLSGTGGEHAEHRESDGKKKKKKGKKSSGGKKDGFARGMSPW
jgi:F-box domain